jgi:hypothetical protein
MNYCGLRQINYLAYACVNYVRIDCQCSYYCNQIYEVAYDRAEFVNSNM